MEEWASFNEDARAAGRARRYHQTVKDFLAFLGDRSSAGLGALTPRDVPRFRNAELRAGKCATTGVIDSEQMHGRVIRQILAWFRYE